MEDDHRVWPPLPPGARHRRSPPPDGDEREAAPPEELVGRRRGHPLDLEPGETVELDEPWNPRIRRTTPRAARPRSGRTPYPDATTTRRDAGGDVDDDVDGQTGWGTSGDDGRDVGWGTSGDDDRDVGWGASQDGSGRDAGWGALKDGGGDTGWGASRDDDRNAGWGAVEDGDRDAGWGALKDGGRDADVGSLKGGGSPSLATDDDPDAEFWGESSSDPEPVSWRSPFRLIPSPASRESSTDALPPSARLYGTPAAPGTRTAPSGMPRRLAFALAALLTGAALVAVAINLAPRLVAPQPGPEAGTGRLSDGLAGVAATLPDGWYVASVPPVSGFTSVARDGAGGLVMARPLPEPVADAKEATAEAAELYSRLLLKGDRVKVVEDRQIPGGHTRALRAEYRDVVNRPAYLRVMLLTRGERSVLLLGLLQPEQTASRQALDTVLTSLR
ncbi:hypothetical protein AB0K40_13855 [Nonomuraea bangladeshensis]|uniref:DUF1795 domain-containing protein n=1 Tax=Nonomuraea bangladeshensis TaxID=404385 RepID=A0ABV3H214_9ACTN